VVYEGTHSPITIIEDQPANKNSCTDHSPSFNKMVSYTDSIIISEGDMDVGEQVTVETDRSGQVPKDSMFSDYKSFVHSFRLCRMKHNYTLVDVIQQVNARYRRRLTLRSMTDFEDLVLDKKKSIPIITVLKIWMKDIDKKVAAGGIGTAQLHGIVPTNYRRRKTRTSSEVIQGLESFFAKKKNPTPTEYRRLAHEWKIEEAFIRSWFSEKRRGNEKESFRMACSDVEANIGRSAVPLLKKGLIIPCQSHEISVEVSYKTTGDTWFQMAPPYDVFV